MDHFNVNQIMEMEMEMMSIPIETGFKCKHCDDNIFGYYLWLKTKMYFCGVCKCSYWLVKSTHLQQIFNTENINILS